MKPRFFHSLCGSLALIAATSFFTSTPAAGQNATEGKPPTEEWMGPCVKGDKPGKPPKGPRWERLQEPLGLTDEQVSELQALQREQHEAMQQLRANTALSKEQRREQAKALWKAHKEEAATILTPAQQAKMQEMRQKWAEKKGSKKDQAPGLE